MASIAAKGTMPQLGQRPRKPSEAEMTECGDQIVHLAQYGIHEATAPVALSGSELSPYRLSYRYSIKVIADSERECGTACALTEAELASWRECCTELEFARPGCLFGATFPLPELAQKHMELSRTSFRFYLGEIKAFERRFVAAWQQVTQTRAGRHSQGQGPTEAPAQDADVATRETPRSQSSHDDDWMDTCACPDGWCRGCN
ncbi:hypothetical protein FB567DRAFT_599205 [Paraphoma chrysanthemicola]|uniref:Uncharacterized protein n=1 Tax=Paraphoma chrysanthemicola TaxID=798071 RepID=A0A8K0VRN6_9PLEO|nr:hypothetical protein FB567DRAFT_599205 [Paraphoma chrysanthemicola]